MAVVTVVCCVGAAAQPDELRVPAGCRAAPGAQASANGYAARIIHDKTAIELILAPSGTFTMGSERYAHPVTIRTPFYVGRTEVTNAQYRRFTAGTDYDGRPDVDPDPDYDLYLRHWRGKSIMSDADDHPVVWVSWRNAKAFCEWAGLALPTEAQWEYACRAGTTTLYYYGDDPKQFAAYGWSHESKEYYTHPVAQKTPNSWGCHDMLGNVWEWVEDDWREGFDNAPTDGSARLEGYMTKVVRGGGWGNSSVTYLCGSSARFNSAPTNAGPEFGFRVVLPLE